MISDQLISSSIFNPITKNNKPIGFLEIDWTNPINRGLIAAFVLNGDTSDTTGFNPPLTRTSSFVGANGGIALSLNGSTYLTYGGSNLSIDATTQLTMEYLVVADDTTTDYIGGQHDQTNTRGFNSYKITGGGGFQFGFVVGNGTSNKFYTGTGITGSINTLYHVVTVYNGDAGIMEVFVDGVSAGSTSSGVPSSITMPTAVGFAMGAQDSGGSLPWTGNIHYAKYWNRALTSEEIYLLSIDRYNFLKPTGSIALPITAVGGVSLYQRSLGRGIGRGIARGL